MYEVRIGRTGMGRFRTLERAVEQAERTAAEEAGWCGTVHWVVLHRGRVVADGIVTA